MPQKNLDPLSLCAGLDITYPGTGVEASLHKAIACFFNKAENTLNILPPKKKQN